MKNIGLIKWFDSEKGFGVILDAGVENISLFQIYDYYWYKSS